VLQHSKQTWDSFLHVAGCKAVLPQAHSSWLGSHFATGNILYHASCRWPSLPQRAYGGKSLPRLQCAMQVLRQHAADADVPVTAAARSTLTCVECAYAESPLSDKVRRPSQLCSSGCTDSAKTGPPSISMWCRRCVSMQRSLLCSSQQLR